MSKPTKLHAFINGQTYDLSVAPNESLLEVLRYRLELTGTKCGCATGDCGACTVLVNGKAVNSCLVLAVEIDGASVTTIEGLSSGSELHPLQQAFVEQGAVQCGFCAPGMIMAAKSLLDEKPRPSEEEIRSAIAGNLCRCTGYLNIVKAITAAAEALRANKI